MILIMGKTSSIHIRVEPEVKEEVEEILNTLGMTPTEAINIYLKQIILNSGIPFEIKTPQFSDEMLEALKEADEIMKNPDAYPSYNSVEELMEALNEE